MSRGHPTVADSIAGTVLDGIEFARSSGVLERRAVIAGLSRLAELVVRPDGVLDVRIEGWRDAEGKSWLQVAVSGALPLRCQRCLDVLEFRLDLRSRLQLIGPGDEWPDDDLADDGADAIAADAGIDVSVLVEDEVLLALPIAPRHAQCELPFAGAGGKGSSPFAALAALKKV